VTSSHGYTRRGGGWGLLWIQYSTAQHHMSLYSVGLACELGAVMGSVVLWLNNVERVLWWLSLHQSLQPLETGNPPPSYHSLYEVSSIGDVSYITGSLDVTEQYSLSTRNTLNTYSRPYSVLSVVKPA